MQDKLQFINFIAFLLKLNWNTFCEKHGDCKTVNFRNQVLQNDLLIL